MHFCQHFFISWIRHLWCVRWLQGSHQYFSGKCDAWSPMLITSNLLNADFVFEVCSTLHVYEECAGHCYCKTCPFVWNRNRQAAENCTHSNVDSSKNWDGNLNVIVMHNIEWLIDWNAISLTWKPCSWWLQKACLSWLSLLRTAMSVSSNSSPLIFNPCLHPTV